MLDLRSPDVKRYYLAGEAHLLAARVLLAAYTSKGASTLGHHAVYLAGYAVECGLKALYLSRSPRSRHDEVSAELKGEVGHNLERLQHLLTTKGTSIPDRITEQLQRVRSKWSSEMRYVARTRNKEEAERIVLAAADVFRWATTG